MFLAVGSDLVEASCPHDLGLLQEERICRGLGQDRCFRRSPRVRIRGVDGPPSFGLPVAHPELRMPLGQVVLFVSDGVPPSPEPLAILVADMPGTPLATVLVWVACSGAMCSGYGISRDSPL